MPLTILTDGDVRHLLDSLSLADVEGLQRSLRLALHEYSTGTQDEGACSIHQPERTSTQSGQSTTLFMPSTSSSGIGMKVVTLDTPSASSTQKKGDVGVHGSLTIMAKNGEPIGFVNAEEITAFRTALASTLLLSRRKQLKTLLVFGSGRQAFWHIRLALLLRGRTIKTVHVINRSFTDRSKNLMKTFLGIHSEVKAHEGWSQTKFQIMTPEYMEYDRLIKEQLRAADVIITTVPSTKPLFDHTILTSTEGRKKGRLIIAIGSYKPHMIEIPTEMLLQAVKPHGEHRHFHKHATEGGVIVVDTLTGCLKEAGEIIQSNLNPMQLVEVGELVMLEGQTASEGETASAEFSEDAQELEFEKLKLGLHGAAAGGEGSLRTVMREDSWESKSSTKSSSGHRSRSSMSDKHRRSSSTGSQKGASKEDAMSHWLSDGNVIYKSVGLGLMDLVIGDALIKLARTKNIGTTVMDF